MAGVSRPFEGDLEGVRRIHGEFAALGIKVAASTIWEILREHVVAPAAERQSTTWADFLRSQAGALLACDFFERVVALAGWASWRRDA
ncbi:hypothetical protein [Micromonospora craterilacus]|uniref:hypothetical protein n=1 Tax=Micromonospora craterilacus TaxID=1655439 RepID=UPI0018F29CEE|nr:hypothetical protein [Micromonospora craterilacus]